MSVAILGSGSAIEAEVDATTKALRTSTYPCDGAGFIFSASTGLITTIAAGTTSAGHLFAFRNGTSTLMIVERIRLRWQQITAFTTPQEVGLQAFVTRGYTAPHTGGTQINPASAGGLKKVSTGANTVLTDARMAQAGALAGGTHTLDALPFLEVAGWSQTGAAPAVTSGFEEELVFDSRYPIVLGLNEGIIVRNTILMGAAGTARAIVSLEWRERATFP